jgi:hypothetical protein
MLIASVAEFLPKPEVPVTAELISVLLLSDSDFVFCTSWLCCDALGLAVVVVVVFLQDEQTKTAKITTGISFNIFFIGMVY